jgi:hypothetical protein
LGEVLFRTLAFHENALLAGECPSFFDAAFGVTLGPRHAPAENHDFLAEICQPLRTDMDFTPKALNPG